MSPPAFPPRVVIPRFEHRVEVVWSKAEDAMLSLDRVRTMLRIAESEGWQHYFSETVGPERWLYFKRQTQ